MVLVGFIEADGSAQAFEPPVRLLPADPEREEEWTAEGVLGVNRYTYRGEITEIGDMDTTVAGERRCLLVDTQLVLESDGVDPYQQDSQERWCQASAPSGTRAKTQPARRVPSSWWSTGWSPPAGPRRSRVRAPASCPSWPTAGWVRSSVISPIGGVVTPRPSVLPTVIEGDDPAVLMSTEAAPVLDAVRIDPGDQTARAWTAALGAIAYGSPLIDPDGGRVFVGTALGEVRALTLDGLVLWSTDVGDSVATKPAVVDGVLVVGSEGGDVVGLDVDDGTERWRTGTGDPVVSWPAAGDHEVVIGSDDGKVRAVDVEDGSVRWSYEAAGAVEAPITATDAGWLVADRNGQLSLVDDEGAEQWAVSLGLVLRTAPWWRANWSWWRMTTWWRWMSTLATCAGDDEVTTSARSHPSRARAAIIAASSGGEVVALGSNGAVVERWDAPASLAGGGSAGIDVGPVTGAGAVWLVDRSGSLQRIGSASGAVEDRTPRWVDPVGSSPFRGSLLFTGAIRDGGDTFVLDSAGGVYEVDPLTGDATATGTLELARQFRGSGVAPVAADGVAYLAAQGSVAAFIRGRPRCDGRHS